MSMSAQRKAIQVLREELITVLSVTLEEAMRTLNQRFDEALAAMAQVDQQQLGFEPDDLDDEEMRSDDGFINDEPEEVESSSSSSDADPDDEMEDLDDDDDDDDDPDEILCFPSPKKRGRTPRGKSKSKAKVPPAVHYKMKPQVGKRKRKAPRRFSPSRVHKDADEPESISDSSGEELSSAAASNSINRLDRDQWNVVRRLSPEQRNRNPWWSRRVAVPMNQVRDGCGYQSENNQIPRMLWDAIAENPNAVLIDTLEARTMEKCGFCGHKKKCTHYITLANGATYYIGRVCVGVAKAWLHLSRLLADARHVELEQVFDALSALETAHAAKAGRRQTPSATNKPK